MMSFLGFFIERAQFSFWNQVTKRKSMLMDFFFMCWHCTLFSVYSMLAITVCHYSVPQRNVASSWICLPTMIRNFNFWKPRLISILWQFIFHTWQYHCRSHWNLGQFNQTWILLQGCMLRSLGLGCVQIKGSCYASYWLALNCPTLANFDKLSHILAGSLVQIGLNNWTRKKGAVVFFIFLRV